MFESYSDVLAKEHIDQLRREATKARLARSARQARSSGSRRTGWSRRRRHGLAAA